MALYFQFKKLWANITKGFFNLLYRKKQPVHETLSYQSIISFSLNDYRASLEISCTDTSVSLNKFTATPQLLLSASCSFPPLAQAERDRTRFFFSPLVIIPASLLSARIFPPSFLASVVRSPSAAAGKKFQRYLEGFTSCGEKASDECIHNTGSREKEAGRIGLFSSAALSPGPILICIFRRRRRS